MEKLSVIPVPVTVLLLLNCRISYSCIGLGDGGFHQYNSNYLCAKPDVLKGQDEGKNFLQQTQMQSRFISTINNESNDFLECCRKRGLPDVCLQKCSYFNYDENSLQRMFSKVDPCPLLLANDMHYCAAQGHDHRKCCTENNVTTTVAGQKCLVFCDQRILNRSILDSSYLPCFERFTNMIECFWSWAQRRYQLMQTSKRSKTDESLKNADHMTYLKTEQPFNNY